MATKKTIPVRADISPGLHPDQVGLATKELAERHQQAAAELFADLYPDIGKVTEIEVTARPRIREVVQISNRGTRHTTTYRDPTGLEVAAGQAAAKIVERAKARITRTKALFQTEREKLRKEIDTDLAAESKHASEIRARLHAMPQKERAVFVGAQINAGDRDTLRAVLDAQPWLSGLEKKEAVELRAHAEHAWFGPQLAQLAAIDDVIGRIELGERELLAAHGKVLGHVETARTAQKQQQEALAALAAEPAA